MAVDPLDILVVDDESELREQIRRLFERDGHRVMAVADGRAAIDRATTGRFDVVLLDVALGGGPDGYEVCRTLRERRNVVPIIMLTALDSEADAVLGLEAGADDYVTKPFGPAELRSRIRAVLRRAGPRALGDEMLRVGPLVLDRSSREVTADGKPVELTFSEFELLQTMMSRPGVLFSDLSACNAYQGALAAAAQIKIPTTFILGERDMMTPARAGKTLAAALPNSRTVVLHGAGHMMMVERPDELLAALQT